MQGLMLLNQLADELQLRLGACHRQTHDGRWVERKIHSDYDLWLIDEGSVDLEVAGGQQRANEGDLVLFYPGVYYTARAGSERCKLIYAHFQLSLGNNRDILRQFPLMGIVPGSAVRREIGHFRTVFWQYRRREAMSYLALKGELLTLLAAVLKYHSRQPRPAPETLSPGVQQLVRLQPVLGHVEQNLHKRIPVREMADLADMSEKYFLSYFKKALGITPGQYVLQRRMAKAREHLYQRRFSIKELAALVGYSDSYSFSKAFKKHHKLPPTDFL